MPTEATYPAAPSIASVTGGVGSVAVTLTEPWSNGGSPITDYVVEYKRSSASEWTTWGHDASASTLSYTITGLANFTAYDVRVSAVNMFGTSDASDVSSVTTKPVGKPASAPKIRSAKLGNGQVTLGIWAPKKNGGTDITGYEYTVDGGATWTAVDSSSTDTSLVITGLDNGTRYTIKVRAVNGAGGGAASNARAVTPRTVSDAPTNVVLTEGNGRIKVDFDAPANTGGSSIIRYGYSINGGSIISFGTVFKPMWMKGLKNGMLHSVKIFAYNAAGWSAPSEAVEATPHK